MNSSNAPADDSCVHLDKPANNFMSIVNQCSDELFDWLSLKELAALNNTCKKLQKLTSDYVQRKYPMKCMKVAQVNTKDVLYWSKDESMQAFTQNVRNLVVVPSTDCLRYLHANHCKTAVSVAFYDGQIMEEDAIYLESLLENAEIVEIQYGSVGGEFHENVLKYGRRMKQLVIKYGFDECESSGIANQWVQHFKCPTLEHFHWSATPLPEHLEIFFRQNPNIRSFNSGVYTTMNVLEFLLRTATTIKELHFDLILELHDDESEAMALIQSHLDALHERGQFQDLMLEFIFCSQLLDTGWAKLSYLTGAYIDFPNRPGSTKALSSLVHLKLLVLGINTILSSAKANTLSKHLKDLEEIYIQIDSFHAIIPFARNCVKLHKIYVYRMKNDRGFDTKKPKHHSILSLNESRCKLMDARKLIVYLPDQAYVQIKCQSNNCLNQNLIAFKRSESHVPMHPFAATKIRKDICELYEKF